MIPKGKEVKRARYTMAAIFAIAVMFCLAFALLTYDFNNLSTTDQHIEKVNTASVNINTDNDM